MLVLGARYKGQVPLRNKRGEKSHPQRQRSLRWDTQLLRHQTAQLFKKLKIGNQRAKTRLERLQLLNCGQTC